MPNYYDILGVDSTASSSEIRKAYLRLSLQHHPDKNPDNVEAAKAKFVVIGQAYETLSDPQKRAMYDRELRSGGGRTSTTNSCSGGDGGYGSSSSSGPSAQSYDDYRDIFDETVAGMSEADLAAAVGTAAIVGGLVGSIVGRRVLGGSSSSGGGFLATAGSMVGSMVASEMAASSVRSLHQQSIQRIEYKQACRRAIERGKPIPDPPPSSNWDQVLQRTIEAVKGVINHNPNGTADSNGNGTRNSMSDLWNKARQAAASMDANNAKRQSAYD